MHLVVECIESISPDKMVWYYKDNFQKYFPNFKLFLCLNIFYYNACNMLISDYNKILIFPLVFIYSFCF